MQCRVVHVPPLTEQTPGRGGNDQKIESARRGYLNPRRHQRAGALPMLSQRPPPSFPFPRGSQALSNEPNNRLITFFLTTHRQLRVHAQNPFPFSFKANCVVCECESRHGAGMAAAAVPLPLHTRTARALRAGWPTLRSADRHLTRPPSRRRGPSVQPT